MILFHGTNIDFREIKLSVCTPHKDFGKGFYLTPILARAKERAKDKCDLEKCGMPLVQQYEFDESQLNNLNVLTFNSTDTEWLDFILSNRNKKHRQQHNYDVVIGPVADDGVITSISLYESRIITKEELIARLRYAKPYIQYCFCTQSAINLLRRK